MALELVRRIVWHWLTCKAVVVVDMPLLFETGAQKFTKPSVLVSCDTATQLRRLMFRDGSTEDAAQARITAQMPLEAKRKLADVVIDNSGSLSNTRTQVWSAVAQHVCAIIHTVPGTSMFSTCCC